MDPNPAGRTGADIQDPFILARSFAFSATPVCDPSICTQQIQLGVPTICEEERGIWEEHPGRYFEEIDPSIPRGESAPSPPLRDIAQFKAG
jgi:hypothetical protein